MKKVKQIIALTAVLVMMTGLFSAVIAEENTDVLVNDNEVVFEAENVTEMAIEAENIQNNVTEAVNEIIEEAPVQVEEIVVEEPAPVAEQVVVEVATEAPTAEPTPAPTAVPTPAPTAVPTVEPTAVPTAVPTPAPTAVPAVEPTVAPAPAEEPVEDEIDEDWFPDEDELIEIDDDVFIEVEETPEVTEDSFEEEFDDDGLLEIDDDEFIEGEIEAPVVFTGHAYITIDNKGMLYYGDEVTLRANVENANMDYSIVWEATDDNGEHWERLESGESISFILTQWNAGRQYRIVLNAR